MYRHLLMLFLLILIIIKCYYLTNLIILKSYTQHVQLLFFFSVH